MSLKFLIVDDSKAMQTIVKRILFLSGYSDNDFRLADNGEEALQEIINWQPDVVFLDWHMEGISGLQVLERVNELELKTKIGFITAEKDESAIRKAKEAGAMFIIHKPFTIDDLLENLVPVLSGVSTIKTGLPSGKEIIFPSTSALSMLLTTIIGSTIKIEKVPRLDIKQLKLPFKIALFGNSNKQVKAVQILDADLTDKLAEAFASSVYKDEAFDDKLFSKALLRALTVVGACFHDIEQEKELKLFKTYSAAKLVDKIITMDGHPSDERLDLKFSFSSGETCFSILYLEEQNTN